MHPNDLADALSITTGQPWQAEPISGPQHYALRCTNDDTHLTVRIQRKRIEITGSFWQGETYLADYLRSSDYTPRQVITVNAERPAVAVAKEISRRLLPAFRTDLARARAIHAERMRQVVEVEAFADQLMQLAGGEVRAASRENDTQRNLSAYRPAYTLRGYTYGDTTSLELRITDRATALRVCQALAAPDQVEEAADPLRA